MREVRVEDKATVGLVTIDARVVALIDSLASAPLKIRKDNRVIAPAAMKSSDIVELTFEGTSLNFYERFSDFLSHFPAREPPKRYHVYELGFTSGVGDVPPAINYYRRALRLWALLVDMADHADDRRLFVLSSDKLEIVCTYATEDLRALEKLAELEADFAASSPSREEKRTLFKRSLLDGLRSCSPAGRFGTLLRNFSTVYDRYWQNFRLFLEGISFDRIFEGYVEKHSKIITELNSVLGGIQTAIIGLPIASFVILEKMTVAPHPTFKNTMLLVGCFVFVAFLAILSLSQGRTLDASTALARELNDEIRGKNPDLAKKLAPSMGRLTRHARWVCALLWIVRLLLIGLICATALTYGYVSSPRLRTKFDSLLFSPPATSHPQSESQAYGVRPMTVD